MYRVSPEIPRVHGILRRFAGIAVTARDASYELPTISSAFIERRPVTLARVGVEIISRGHEEAIYRRVKELAEWYTGRHIIGCGADALITRGREGVVKFAPRPVDGNAVDVARELRRRYELACRYLGDMMLETSFEPGLIDGASRPSVVVMLQPYIENGRDATEHIDDEAVYLQLAELRQRSTELFEAQGVIVDARPGAGNILLDEWGNVRLVDAVASHTKEHGKRRMLSPHRADTAHDIGHLAFLPRAVHDNDLFGGVGSEGVYTEFEEAKDRIWEGIKQRIRHSTAENN